MAMMAEQDLIIKHTYMESCHTIAEEPNEFDASDTDAPAALVPPTPERYSATPEVSPLRMPHWNMLPPRDNKYFDMSLPAAAYVAETNDMSAVVGAYQNLGWWPSPYDTTNSGFGMTMEQQLYGAQYYAQENVGSGADAQGDVMPHSATASCADTWPGDTSVAAKETRTTVMLRGFPESYSRAMVLRLLDDEGFFGRYNFVYLPVDFKRQKNLGYALINLVSASEAMRFGRHFEGYSKWSESSESACTVAWCSPQQGLQAHIERYRNSPVMHESVPEEWRPLLLMHGIPVPFPPPTMKIKAPKLKGSK